MKESAVLFLLAGRLLASAGEISEYYYKQARNNTNWTGRTASSSQKSRSHQQVESTNHGITEIGIERCGSFWGGPIYTFIARSNGTFTYKGEKGVERTGEWSGTILIWQFHGLAKFIKDSGFMDFENEYRREVTDNPTTFTGVVLKGTRKIIRNYANSGPTTLWAIEQLIDDLMAKAQWKQGSPQAPAPVLPKVTPFDNEPVLRAAYLDSFRKGYVDAWERKESLPISSPTSEADKAKVLGYAEGMVSGRDALDKWFGTNSTQIVQTNHPSQKR